jgi:hypothetical protein
MTSPQSSIAQQALEKAFSCEHRLRDIVNGLGGVSSSPANVTSTASVNVVTSQTLAAGSGTYRILVSAGYHNSAGQALVTSGLSFTGTSTGPTLINGFHTLNSTTGENVWAASASGFNATFQGFTWPTAGAGAGQFFAMGSVTVSAPGTISLFFFGSASTTYIVNAGAILDIS